MPRFEDRLLGLLPKKTWLNVGTDVTRQNDPIDGLVSDVKTDDLIAEWESLAAEYQIPVMAKFHAFDTEAQKTVRVPIDVHNIEKGLIKVKIDQSERMRALARNATDDTVFKSILNDGMRLADQVFTRSKVAKNEMLATGKVTIKENNINVTVDYGVDPTHLNLTFNVNEGADVPAQLQTIIDSALSAGVTITGMLCSRTLLTKLRKNEAIQKEINGNYGVGALVRRTALEDYLNEEFGISEIVTNDLTYGKDYKISKSTNRPTTETAYYYPRNKVTFFARINGRQLGTGLWGNPPEVDADADLRARPANEIPYVYVSQYAEKDPVVTWTKASALYMPVLFNPDSLWVANVTDTEG